jgi:hypothetical protein
VVMLDLQLSIGWLLRGDGLDLNVEPRVLLGNGGLRGESVSKHDSGNLSIRLSAYYLQMHCNTAQPLTRQPLRD